jgi:hypothetical protein
MNGAARSLLWKTSVRIIVESAELEPGITNCRAVADYVNTMLTIRALKRATTAALRQAEQRAQRLTMTELREANGLLYSSALGRRPGGFRNE